MANSLNNNERCFYNQTSHGTNRFRRNRKEILFNKKGLEMKKQETVKI
jgi:hypothetical protein